MWCVGKEIINVTRIFILVLRNDVVQLFVGESTCRVVGYLFKIFKRSKEANNKRQRLESKLYIGFLLFIFSSSSSYLWIAFSISNCLFRSVFLKEKFFLFVIFTSHFHRRSYLLMAFFWVFSVAKIEPFVSSSGFSSRYIVQKVSDRRAYSHFIFTRWLN